MSTSCIRQGISHFPSANKFECWCVCSSIYTVCGIIWDHIRLLSVLNNIELPVDNNPRLQHCQLNLNNCEPYAAFVGKILFDFVLHHTLQTNTPKEMKRLSPQQLFCSQQISCHATLYHHRSSVVTLNRYIY